MARKSRTQPKQSPDTLNVLSKVYKTAIYVRLSAEKDETRDRKTLINQRNLIKNFVDQQMDMEIHDIYMDDEISGTTFDRPEFERMMSDMRAGRINCIVVKDLSRLGRDYIETGNLVERVFPMMNIRFVAITDNYDSSKKDADLMVAVTNIANDLYAKDISKKISSSKQEAMEKGIPVGRVTYGYKVVLDENKVRVMVEDKEAADVVRWIFNEAEKGTLHSVIAAELNAKHILTPAQYKVRHNIEKLEKLRGVKWTVDTLSQILKNDNYDSDRNFGVTGGMDVAYKNLIYQLYSMDLSRKVKSARRTRNLSGEYTASFVCYGYKKDPDDKHKLIIDEEAAKVVVEIFSLIIAGYNASEVARILNERKIPTRVQNQWKNGINYVPVHNKGDYMWDNSEVIAIVQNEQYKGIMIQNKCETVGFGDNKKVRKRNKEDWSVVEGAIPRIVSDEMFDEVNKMLRVEARGIEKSTKKRKKNLFICPYCGRKLMNSSAVCTPKLLCPKRRMVRTGECQQIFMLKSEAQDKVLEITKEICRTLIQEEELKKASKDKRKVTSDEYLISELKAEYDRISNSTVSCYQSYREGKYTKEEYVQLRKKNQELLADLENQISDLQEKVANQEPDAEEKIEQLTQYSMLEQYDGDVLSNIIDKVLIYNDKDIEVVFKGENFIRNAV